jgi:FkbM family methyltransferase
MSSSRRFLKRLITGNPISGVLYKRRYERRLAGVLKGEATGCEVHPVPGYQNFGIRKGNNLIILNLVTDAITGALVAKSFDTFFSAVQPEIRGPYSVADYSRPKLHTLADGLQFEFSSFPEAPGSVEDYTAWYRPKAGDTVFDIGANCGISVYQFAQMVGPQGKVIAFEPDPLNSSFLKRNVQRHQLANVTIVEAAVGKTDGTAQFYAEGTMGSGLANVQDDRAREMISVPLVSLRTAFARYGVPELCKMDIEGAEIEAIEGLGDDLAKLRVQFVIETAHYVDGAFTDARVEARFRKAGYIAETLKKGPDLLTYGRPA